VPAGYVAFEGKLPKPVLSEAELPITFSFKLYDGAASDPRSIAIVDSGTGKILSPDAFVLTLKSTQLQFSRVLADSTGDDKPTEPDEAGRGGFKPDDGGSGGSSRAGAGGKGGTGGAARPTAGRGGSGGAGSSARDDDEEGGAGGKGGSGGDDSEAGRGASGRGASGSGGSAGGAARGCEGPILPGATCDHVAQCGCDERENCRFDGTDPPSCFPAGDADKGEECAEDSDCAAGTVCVAGLCAQMCREDDDCNGHCVGVTIGDEDVEGYLAILDQCDPVLAAVCYIDPRPNTAACRPCKSGATCLPTAKFAGCFAAAFVSLRDPGDICTSDEECFGGGCNEGRCAIWCRDEADCADPGAMCQTGLGYFANTGDEIGMCTPGFSQDDP
jgi:hypothetical protein